MKQNIYVFADTQLGRKDATLFCEKIDTCGREHPGMGGNPYEAAILSDKELFLREELPRCNGEKKFFPVESVDAIYAFGTLRFNSRLLQFLSGNQIPLHLFTAAGSYSGSFMPAERLYSGSTLIKQVNSVENKTMRLAIAKQFVHGASHNLLANLVYYANRGRQVEAEVAKIRELIDQISRVNTVGSLMGIEGSIKKVYYQAWPKLLKNTLPFSSRQMYPSPDPVNALISYGNAVVYGVCLNEIYHTRLYPELSYLHESTDGRTSLVYDIAEVFKPLITDRALYRIVNKGMVDESGFFYQDGQCCMKPETKKIFINALEEKLATTIEIRETGRSISYRRLIREECYNLLKQISGGQQYNSFKTKW